MKEFLETHPTAEIAGAGYLARALAKLPAFVQQRRSGRATNPPPTAAVAGIEYRAESSQRQWLGLLTWSEAP